MTTVTNTQKNSGGVVNHTTGRIVTDAVAAAAQSFTLGFKPRKITFRNATDRISDEWYEGMNEAGIYTALLGITAKLDAETGVTDTDYAALWNPTASSLTLTTLRTAIVGILTKLDADAGVTDANYLLLCGPAVGADAVALRASITAMNAKLDADGGITATDYAATWPVSGKMSLHTVANGTVTLDLTNGIGVVDNVFTVTATTLVASKVFYWEAHG